MSENEKIREQLSAYLDEELSPSERKRVQEALDESPELLAELDELRSTRKLLRALPLECADDDFALRVMAAAERGHLVGATAPHEQHHAFPWVRHLATAAVLLIAVGVGVIVTVELWPPGPPGDGVARKQKDDADIELARDDTRTEKPEEKLGKASVEHSDVEYGEKAGKGSTRRISRRGQPELPASPAPVKPVIGKEALDRSLKDGKRDDVFTKKVKAGSSVPDAYNEVIYTDRLDAARSDVAAVLARNGIEPITRVGSQPADRKKLARQSRANFYQTNRASPRQIEIVAFVTDEQLIKVQKELNAVRTQQVVSQSAIVPRGDTGRSSSGARVAGGAMAAKSKVGGVPAAKDQSAAYSLKDEPKAEQVIAAGRVNKLPGKLAEGEDKNLVAPQANSAKSEISGLAAEPLRPHERGGQMGSMSQTLSDTESTRKAPERARETASRPAATSQTARQVEGIAAAAPLQSKPVAQGQRLLRERVGAKLNTLVITLNLRAAEKPAAKTAVTLDADRAENAPTTQPE